MGKDWALVVGIDRYPNAGVNALEGAVADAESFHKWVTDPQGGGIADAECVELIKSPAANVGGVARPALSEILNFFFRLREVILAGGEPGRRLYVFLSGHGISPSGAQSLRNAALLMANAMQPNKWDNFPANIWAEGIRGAALFDEVILIMDCCRDLKNDAEIMPHIFGAANEDGKSGLLLEAYATQWASKARELPVAPDNKKRGVFTCSVLEVLRAGRMTGSMFKASVKAHLTKRLADQKKPQQTEIKGSPDDSILGQIIFNENAQEPRTPVRIKGLGNTPPTVLCWPEGDDAATPVVLQGWGQNNGYWQGTLAPGHYLLQPPGKNPRRLNVHAAVDTEITV